MRPCHGHASWVHTLLTRQRKQKIVPKPQVHRVFGAIANNTLCSPDTFVPIMLPWGQTHAMQYPLAHEGPHYCALPRYAGALTPCLHQPNPCDDTQLRKEKLHLHGAIPAIGVILAPGPMPSTMTTLAIRNRHCSSCLVPSMSNFALTTAFIRRKSCSSFSWRGPFPGVMRGVQLDRSGFADV